MTVVNRCIWLATSAGIGDFVENIAAAGFQTMEAAGAIDQFIYSYVAQSGDLTQWETGEGVWTLATKTLARTKVWDNSVGGTTPLNFLAAPQVMITPLTDDLSILAEANISLFVALTGSDSNTGSAASPFLTVAQAVKVAARYDYAGLYNVTIIIGAGTFNNATSIELPALTRGSGILSGAGVGTTILLDVNGNGGINCSGVWRAQNLTVDSSEFCFRAVNGGQIFITGPVGVQTSLTPKECQIFAVGTGGYIEAQSQTITVGANLFFAFFGTYFKPGGSGSFRFRLVTVNLDPGFTYNTGTWVFGAQYSGKWGVIWTQCTVNNKANFTATRVDTSGSFCYLVIDNTTADFPGSHDVEDMGEMITGINTNLTVFKGNNTVSQTNASAFSVNSWSVAKDPFTLRRVIAFNDNGTIYQRQIGNFINTQVSTSYTLVIDDMEGIVEMNNAGANTVGIPSSTAVAFPVGTKISVAQIGVGATSVASVSTGNVVTVHNAGPLSGQYGGAVLCKRGTDEWTQFNGAF